MKSRIHVEWALDGFISEVAGGDDDPTRNTTFMAHFIPLYVG